MSIILIHLTLSSLIALPSFSDTPISSPFFQLPSYELRETMTAAPETNIQSQSSNLSLDGEHQLVAAMDAENVPKK
jgi:hypothetical protein